ncbi:nitrogen regulation protein NR(II) [Pseudahrensia aquimaris]|uniref:histidine kinase n=1 Tax=Pseudahrensia aquimaris TaxID=744461 RepID=A0ABW3FAK5_9HYPH
MVLTESKSVFGDAALLPLSVLNALSHPVFMLDGDGVFSFANTSAEIFFQTSLSVLLKRKVTHYITEGSPLLSLIAQVRRSNSPISEYRMDLSSPRTGAEKLVDVYVSPNNERPNEVVVLMQVRSIAETMDRQLTHRGAARTVTGLASMLAHEIKNPLSGIRGAAQLLEAAGSEDDRTLTRLITDETDRIVRLVDRMEVFSDERPIERDPVNIHSVLEQVKQVARTGFAKNVAIVEEYDPSLPPVLGNRDQLVQVFLNLVKNASEAMRDTPEPQLTLRTAFRPGIRIAAPGSPERVSLPISMTVSDTGPGVPDDLRSYMFDPFISSKQNGSGLGLALVAKIVGDHGGIVSCESDANGTTFEVLMPMWREPQTEREGEAANG